MTWHLFDTLTCTIGGILTLLLYFFSYKKKSYQLAAYIPTVWTSLGILFTFISIYNGLDGYKDSDPLKLIQNIIPAFSTSIIGIIGSIVTSIVNKTVLATIEQKVEINEKETFRAIAPLDSNYSPELVLIAIVDAINKQTKEINSGNSSIQGRFDNLFLHLNRLNGETKSTVTSLLSAQKNDFEKAVADLRTLFEGTLNTQKSVFEKTVSGLRASFEVTLSAQNRILENKLNTLDSTLGTKIESMNTKFDGTINRLVDVTGKSLASESDKRNKDLKEFISAEKKDITEFIERQTKIYKGINDKFDATISDIRRLFENDVKQLVDKFAEEQHKVSVETLAQWNSKLIADAEICLNEHLTATRNNMHELDEKTKETFDSFRETIQGIAQIVADKLQGLYEHQTGLIGETIEGNRGQLIEALSENRQNIQTILDANEQVIRKVSTEIKTDNDEIKQELIKAQNEWKKEALRIEAEHLDEVKRIHTDAEQAINGILLKITSYESNIQQSLNVIKEELIKSVQEFKEKITDIEKFIVDNNKGLQSDLRQQIHDAFQVKELEVACGRMVDSINSTMNSLNANTKGITNNLSAINTSLGESSKKYIDTVVNSNDLLTYINETLLVDKQHITGIVAMLGEIEQLKKAAGQIEEDIKRIQSLQGGRGEN